MSEPLPAESDALRCDLCGKPSGLGDIRDEDMKHPVLENTLTDLPDHNSVDWKCPKCGWWNSEKAS